MPVEKFRTLDEARAAMDARQPHATLPERVRALHAISDYLSPHRFARGVRRFRSIEEANRDREEQERASQRGS